MSHKVGVQVRNLCFSLSRTRENSSPEAIQYLQARNAVPERGSWIVPTSEQTGPAEMENQYPKKQRQGLFHLSFFFSTSGSLHPEDQRQENQNSPGFEALQVLCFNQSRNI